ncbi:hypothetical protein CKO15_07860 [Halorhodospira abdelmalekii]|uniref:putative photosynthetic complex assembly protein PuhE n=1 Tax=Halorhodospira abdelmalekii TaxID=421629 RepID=UPI00190558D4|nr:putative photosynthetic complex assembly protein PuhE [Halorhodospira abdelmalekii]MBK1735200.1 hypothetical protein [Halorhodospira abdelmalekii]
MFEYVLPVLFALFLWWFSTGVVIYLDNLPMRTFRWSMIGGTVAMFGGLYLIAISSAPGSVASAYLAFTGTLLVWAWVELSYYTNYVTGPRQTPCPEGTAGWHRFRLALQSNLYHELAILVLGIVIFLLCWRGGHYTALWAYLVLAWMHESARLNVFLGVRNPNEEFVPAHMHFVRSFIRRRPMNLLFPFSVTVSTVALVLLIQQAVAPGVDPYTTVGLILVATLMALAILEHWFLVIPLPTAVLWHWGLKARGSTSCFTIDVVMGPLGAGKTTFIRRLLEQEHVADERAVVLISDFSDRGVDAAVLRAEGAEVIDFVDAGGYGALHKELAEQLREIARDYAPQRILIEPSGSRDAVAVLEALQQPSVQGLVRGVRCFTVIDAETFQIDYARNPEGVRSEILQSPALVVNKIDRVVEEELQTVISTLREINPQAQFLHARYGAVDAAQLAQLPRQLPQQEDENRMEAGDAARFEPVPKHGPEGPLWSTTLEGTFDVTRLRELLEEIAAGRYGELKRVKGIARLASSWVRFDVAGGRVGMTAFTPDESEVPRVVAIGPAASAPEPLEEALRRCARASREHSAAAERVVALSS